MSEEDKIKNNSAQSAKKPNIPKRKNPPIFPVNIAVGVFRLDEVMIVDIMDSQSLESNVAYCSFALTKRKAEQLKKSIERFLSENDTEDSKNV